MENGNKLVGYKIPLNVETHDKRAAEGFITPKQDRSPQIHAVLPKRVIPIIFIPGIMGSNLRMNLNRQARLKKKSNLAWRPDNLFLTVPIQGESAAERQLRFDPAATELDIYDPDINATGDAAETSDLRNKNVNFSGQYSGSWKRIDGPLLQSDRPGSKKSRTRDQKARARGWGEIFFSSYQEILSTCEARLNGAFSDRHKDSYLMNSIADVSPSKWGAYATPVLSHIDEKTMRESLKGCWFPVHAMGYNWLNSNMDSGIATAERILDLIKKYQDQNYQCEKVILITHSMGGLVARAIIHPKMGGIEDKVLGVIHGVMPAIGAGAAYKRMRCGFEGDDTSAKILGMTGDHVTPVLGNSQGGLELLPSQAYGNGWLRMIHKGQTIKTLPADGDPYEEIYKVQNKWFGLLREVWINPAALPGSSLRRTHKLLDGAKKFHDLIVNTYHEQSYAHYGADLKGLTWNKVVWEIESSTKLEEIDQLQIFEDDCKGKLAMREGASPEKTSGTAHVTATLLDPVDPGDQTVPVYSADAQLRSGKFKGIFRQSGYEHQKSYSNEAVIAATVFSLFKIISTMKWSR